MLYNIRHKSYPLLAHAPSNCKCNPLWNVLKQSVIALPLFTRLSDEVSILTYNNGATKTTKPPGVLESQLTQLSIPHVVLGKNAPSKWQHRFKMHLIAEHLKVEQKPYVILADSSDVFVFNKLEPLLDRFLSYNCEALMSRDPFLWPKELTRCGDFETSVCPDSYPGYLCAGLWMAKTEFCKELIDYCIGLDNECIAKGFPPDLIDGCDQQYLHLSFRDFYPKIQIDYNCTVFQTVVGKEAPSYLRFMRMF